MAQLLGTHRGRPLRIKIRLGDTGLVIPCKKENEKVEVLLREIATRFESHGIKPGELRIAQLQTSDGYLINPNDIISQVISDGEHLVALDYDDWLQLELPRCKTEWARVLSQDFDNDDYKWIIVGEHEHNKIFVKFGLNYPGGKNAKVLRLELFDRESLQHFAKEGKILLGSKEDPEGKWKEEAFFDVEKGNVKAIEISVVTPSDPKPLVKRLEIELGQKLKKKSLTWVNSNYDDYDPMSYKIPENTSTGPVIDDKPPPERTLDDAQVGGTDSLQITQTGKIESDQTHPYNGEWRNQFVCPLTLLNKTESKMAITNVSSEYLSESGEWKEMKVRVGAYYGFLNYSWSDSTHFDLEPKAQTDMCVGSYVVFTTPKKGDRERRAHKSLPQPLKIRITFQDVDGNKASVTVEQCNGPLDLITREKREKDKGPADLWLQCDDTEGEYRIYAEIRNTLDKQEYFEIWMNGSNGKYVYLSSLQEEVHKSDQECVEWKDLNFKTYDSTIQGYILVDRPKKRAYAIKLVLKTSTSTVEGYYRIPKFPQPSVDK